MIVTARNENGKSESATVKINIVPADIAPNDNDSANVTPDNDVSGVGSSGSGCNSGFTVTIIAILALIKILVPDYVY